MLLSDPGGVYLIYSDAYQSAAGYGRSALAGEYRDQTLGMVVTASNGIEDVTLNRPSPLAYRPKPVTF